MSSAVAALRVCTALLLVLQAPWALAQSTASTYPTRPIRIVVPFPPGGATDMIDRTPDEFGRYIRAEIAKRAAVVKKSGARLD